MRTITGHSIARSILFGMFVVSSFAAFTFANAQTVLEGADQECVPAIVDKCGCGEIVDPKTGECVTGKNKYQCICSQTDPGGGSTTGTCDATERCHTITTNGKAPSPVTPQQMQTNNGNSANGTGAGSSGGTPQISSNPGITAPQNSSPVAPEQTNTESPNASGLPTGSSLLNSAYQWLTGQDNASPQPAQPTDNSSANPQSSSEPSWLSGAQYQIQSELSPSSENSPTNVMSGSVPGANEGTTFQSNVAAPMGDLPMSSQDLQNIQAANASVNLTPAQQATQDLQAIQGTAKSVGGWVQSTFFPADQQALAVQQLSPQNTSDVRATIYIPGSGGDSGPVYGSGDNYLNPNIPTVAAGFSSPYQYGDVLNITNPSTGQTINAVVGDTCPGCGTGIDLTPAAANPIGFNLTQGVGTMEVGVVASTGSYTAGAQLASAMNSQPDPWAGTSAAPTTISNPDVLGVATVNDYANAALASTQYTNDQIAAESAAYAAASAQEVAGLDSNADRPSGNLSSLSTGEAISATDVTQSEPIPAGVVEQGPVLEQPNPTVGVVTSAPLPLSDQQVESQIPVPEQVQSNPQAEVEAANQLDNQNAQDQILNDHGGQPVPVSATLEEAPSSALVPIAASQEGGLSGGAVSSEVALAPPTEGAPSFQSSPQLPSWANTVVSDMQSAETSVSNDYQALANQFAPASSPAASGNPPAAGQSTEASSQENAQPIENPPLPQPRPAFQSSYSGSSIVNYLSSAGQDFSYAARAALAESQGIANYVGSAVQNLQLLKNLRGF